MIATLSQEELERGIVSHSSGNCGLAMALAARGRDTPCMIVVPKNIAPEKRYLLTSLGASYHFAENSLESRRVHTERLAREREFVAIDPFEDPRVIAAQGTAVLELLEQVGMLDVVLVPVGSGGLLASTLVAVRTLQPGLQVVGCEPRLAPDAFNSVQQGRLIEQCAAETVCDGLRTNLGDFTFQIIRELVDDMLLASEDSILKATALLCHELRMQVEASAAVTLAALVESGMLFEGRRVGIVLTGGNSPQSIASRVASQFTPEAM